MLLKGQEKAIHFVNWKVFLNIDPYILIKCLHHEQNVRYDCDIGHIGDCHNLFSWSHWLDCVFFLPYRNVNGPLDSFSEYNEENYSLIKSPISEISKVTEEKRVTKKTDIDI